MFKILNDKKATSEQLAGSYVEIENHIAGLQQDRQAVHSQLVEAKQATMAGNGDKKTLTKFKNQQDDIDLEIEASESALTEIKSRIASTVPGETQTRIDDLTKNYDQFLIEKKKRYREYLKAAAELAVLKVQLDGIELTPTSGGDWSEVDFPDIGLNTSCMVDDDAHFLRGEFAKAREKVPAGGEPLNRQEDAIIRELSRLEDLFNTDPAAAADRMIHEARQ